VTDDAALLEYRDQVLTLLTDGLAVFTLAASLLVLLVAIAVVRHW
jgi:hypothetical protein